MIPFLRGEPSGASAGVLTLESSLAGQVVELGTVRGDVPPPKLAADAQQSLVALPDNDASGGSYRLGWLFEDRVEWFADVDQFGDQSPAFDLLLLPNRGILAWDDWDKPSNRSQVRLATFTRQRPTPAPSVTVPVPAATDAEQPRLMARPGGAWLSWIALGAPAVASGGRNDEPSVLQPNHSWLELMPVDDTGRSQGEALQITPRTGHVVAYDGIAAHDGSVLFAVRDADTLAELDEGSVRLVRVLSDGSVSEERLEIDNLGAGAPNLVFDSAPGDGAPHGWLVLASGGGSTLLAGLTPWGTPLEVPRSSPGLGIAGVLGAQAGQLLVVTPHGRDAMFTAMRCRVDEGLPDASASPL